MNAEIHPVRTPAELSLADAFHASKSTLPGNGDVAQFREDCFRAFYASGLPHRHMESWHYTDLRAAMRAGLKVAAGPGPAVRNALLNRLARVRLPAPRLVLADGFYVPELSSRLPPGVTVRSLASALAEGRQDFVAWLASHDRDAQDPVIRLNAALMQDGVVIEVAPGAKIPEPVHLIHVGASPAPEARFCRSILIIGAGASLHFAESSPFGKDPLPEPQGQLNNCLIIAIGNGAALSHTADLTGIAPHTLQIDSVMARIGSEAKFDSFALTSGRGFIRRQLFVRLEGRESEAKLSGVSLLGGREHADTTLRVEHSAEACLSRETFKYILDDQATGVFQGRIQVNQGAQNTDARMLCNSILLSDTAAMNTKPELEIFADEVACGHGATCGGLDADQLFYLQSRGLPFAQATAVLLEGFADELVGRIGHKDVAASLREAISAWLGARCNGQAAPLPDSKSGQ
jgi:Fe-S cluster assembly protein SufD